MDEIAINCLNNDVNGKYDKQVQVQDQAGLSKLLRNSLDYLGFEGNYNWIDTSKVTSFTNLFKNTYGDKRSLFNGDISRWDVSNVKAFQYAFEDCTSLTCDISNWNVKNAKFFDSATWKNTNTFFERMCKELFAKSEKWCLRKIRK